MGKRKERWNKIMFALEYLNSFPGNKLQIVSYKPDKYRFYALQDERTGARTGFMRFDEFYYFLKGLTFGIGMNLEVSKPKIIEAENDSRNKRWE